MRRLDDLSAFVAEKDVVITTQWRVGRPFISWKYDKAIVFTEAGRRRIQVTPKVVRQVKIVCLVTGDIQMRNVAGKFEIRLYGILSVFA